MRLLNARNSMTTVLSLLLVLAFATCAQAFSLNMSGPEAEKSLSLLRVAPYVKYGSGSKVVYVVGSPDCSQTRAVFQLMQNMRNEYEFRWIFKVPKNKKSTEDKYFGVYENRDADLLAAALTGGSAPVRNAGMIKYSAQLARSIGDIIVLDFKKKSVNFPLLVVPVSGGLRAMDFRTEMQDAGFLGNFMSPAIADAPLDGVDMDLIMQDISRSNPVKGQFCARADTPYSILPYGGARELGVLPAGTCLDGVNMLDSGWVGVRYMPDPAVFGPAYIRADMVFHHQ